MTYELPVSLAIGDSDFAIRYDYRAVLDICTALADPELNEQEKAITALGIFYPEIRQIPRSALQEALEKCFWFINGGDEERGPKGPRLMDWEQDFRLIVAPINRVIGREVRGMEELHWWSFLSAYMEIGGDCTFAQVVSLRDKLARHKKLDKAEREWLRNHRHLVDFKMKYTEAEDELVKQWI